jgi:DNA invertase Pin-like site-specific DNA recombinase
MNIVYLRVSTEDQNPENQKKEVLSLSEGLEVTIFEENQSAFKDDYKREQFNKILELIRKGKVKNFYAWDLDRIYRNRLKLKEFFELCRIKGVQVSTFRQDWLRSLKTENESLNAMLQDLLINLLGWLAEEESSKKSQRVKIAYQNKKGANWGRPKVEISYKVRLAIENHLERGYSIRHTAEMFGIKKNLIEKIKKETGKGNKTNSTLMSVKSPLEKCNSFIKKFDSQDCPTKEQLKDK